MRLFNFAAISFCALATALPAMVAANTADPLQCNDLAPGLTEQHVADGTGSYYDLDAIALDPDTRANADNLRAMLSGRWSGTVLSEACTGHFKEPVKEQLKYRVRNAEAETLYDGDIRVEAMVEGRRTVKVAKLFLSLKRSYSVEQLDKQTWVFTEKYRARSLQSSSSVNNLAPSVTGNASRLMHEVKTVQLDNGKVTVDHAVYVNGFFVSRDGWVLNRG